MMPSYTSPWGWHLRDDPNAPDWYRGHDVWNRDFGRRFWPVPIKRAKRR